MMTLNKKNKKFLIKIPKYISVFYFKSINFIIFKGKKKIRFLTIDSKLKVFIFKNQIFLFNDLFKLSNNFKKITNNFKKMTLLLFKKIFIEIKVKIFNNLKFVGIGYKFFPTNFSNILLFKLGYSHSIFFKLNFVYFNLKSVKLFIVSNFYKELTFISGLIRKFKIPEIYKGKGIIFKTEKIKLKKGKKN